MQNATAQESSKEAQHEFSPLVPIRTLCNLIGALHEVATHAKFKPDTELEREAKSVLRQLREITGDSLDELGSGDHSDEFKKVATPISLLRWANKLIERNTPRPCVPVRKREPKKILDFRR